MEMRQPQTTMTAGVRQLTLLDIVGGLMLGLPDMN
jgi:hypothetical protein